MGFFGDLSDWWTEQKKFKEAEDYLRDGSGESKRSMLSYVSSDFKDIVVNPTKEDYKEFKQSVTNDNQQLKNDFKGMCEEISPVVGEAVERIDRFTQTRINNIEAIIKLWKRKSISDVSELKEGDHLFVDRGVVPANYTHHALYCGSEQVIHYQDFVVKYGTLDEFSKGSNFYVLDSPILHSRQMTIARAKSRLGETEYNLGLNNCEHFVSWCRSGN